MEIYNQETNSKQNKKNKRYQATVYVSNKLLVAIDNTHKKLLKKHAKNTFTSVTSILQHAVSKIKENDYKKYEQEVEKYEIDYLNSYKNKTIILNEATWIYWRSLPKGNKTKVLDVILKKFVLHGNFDF